MQKIFHWSQKRRFKPIFELLNLPNLWNTAFQKSIYGPKSFKLSSALENEVKRICVQNLKSNDGGPWPETFLSQALN